MRPVEECLGAIRLHTEGLATAAQGNLHRRIEHCPDWTMADLVWHLTNVHWFWNLVASTRPPVEPDGLQRPARPADPELIGGLLSGMEALLATLGAADQQAPCWTWGLEENVGFITRHQVQEAAVHHWDALNAIGRSGDWSMAPLSALDACEEFLTHSVANRRWPRPDAEPIGGTIWFCTCGGEVDRSPVWHLHDGDRPGTVSLKVYDGGVPEIVGASDGDHVDPATLLLWLYRRVPDPADGTGRDQQERPLLDRFRALTSSD